MRVVCDVLCDVVLCASVACASVCYYVCVLLYECVSYVSYCVRLHGLCASSLCDRCACLCVLYTQMFVRGVVSDLVV